MPSEPQLISFVLRFVVEPLPEEGGGSWRGFLRHVQSDAEQHFARWEDAVAFIERYVSLERGGAAGGDGQERREGAG